MTNDTQQSLAERSLELLCFALQEVDALADSDELARLSSSIALPSDVSKELIDKAIDATARLGRTLQTTHSSTATAAQYQALLACALAVIESLNSLSSVSAAHSGNLGGRALGYFLTRYLQRHLPLLDAILMLLGVFEGSASEDNCPVLDDDVEVESEAEEGTEPPPLAADPPRTFHPRRIVLLLRDPTDWAEVVYKWRSGFDVTKLLDRISHLARKLGIGALLTEVPRSLRAWLGVPDARELRIPLLRFGSTGLDEAGVALAPLRTCLGGDGLLITFYVNGVDDPTIYKGSVFDLRLNTESALPSGIGFVLEPGRRLSMVFAPGGDGEEVELDSIGFEVVQREPIERLWVGGPGGLRAGVRESSFVVGIRGDPREGDLFAEARLSRLFFGLDTTQADGFLSRILPLNVESEFELAVGWSASRKIYFGGSATLDVVIPVHSQIGAVSMREVQASLGIESDDEISAALTTSFGFTLGPIGGSIDRIGVEGKVFFPDEGNGLEFGGLQFRPPTGVGLAVTTNLVTGGGFLRIDIGSGEYSGSLALKCKDIGVTAIGLITTKMPDGSRDFSLLISIGVTFSPPIQLSFGFTLSGVGGLIGVNRRIDIEALRTGLKTGSLSSILFPDPATLIPNAAKIISDMGAAFPVQPGRYVLGPMVKLGWGSPNIITADVGIFLELPEPVKAVVLGQLEALLPEKANPLIILRLDVLGVLEFAKRQLTFQAALYDSSVFGYPVSGDSAFLLGWGDDAPRLALSMGGFHPRFSVPEPAAVFAGMKRLSIDISASSNLHLTCSAYHAITPNSRQFGAQVELYAKKGAASITGTLGFDALISVSPFSFDVTMDGKVAVEYKGEDFTSIDLTLWLSGPRPWVGRVKAKLELLFITVPIKFTVTWGDESAVSIPAVDPWPDVQRILRLRESWSAKLPIGKSMVEVLRGDATAPAGPLVLHPLGRLEVRQTVPLGMVLSRASSAPIAGHNRFEIRSVDVDGCKFDVVHGLVSLNEYFARGQWEDLGDAALSVPSFEKMPAGVATGTDNVQACGDAVDVASEYETILIDEHRASKSLGKSTLPMARIAGAFGTRAKRQARDRAGPQERFAGKRSTFEVKEEAYALAEMRGATRSVLQRGAGLTRTEADRQLRSLHHDGVESRQSLLVMPEYEVTHV
jgi:hypothetical protein